MDWIQLRDRSVETDRLFAATCAIVAARDAQATARRGTRRRTTRVLVNRRLDVVLAAGADGVHLGFDAPEPADARRLLGPDALVGVSCHQPEEVYRAEADGADYAR